MYIYTYIYTNKERERERELSDVRVFGTKVQKNFHWKTFFFEYQSIDQYFAI